MQAWRSWLLVGAVLAWYWAGSVFAPWAVDGASPEWVHDAVFYAGFAVLFWTLAEFGVAIQRRARMRAYAAPLAVVGIAILAWVYEHTEAGLRFRVHASDAALQRSAALPYETPRHRAGHFLIDTVRDPCNGEAWLWLGRPFGGGHGTGRALVRSEAAAPGYPREGDYTFRRVAGSWWMAKQAGSDASRGVARCPSR